MNDKEIIDMCRRLASKYYNHQDYDDIFSEGVVLCLKLREDGVKEPSKLYYNARTAMYEFVNVGMSKLSYPKGRGGRIASEDETVEYVDAQDEQIPSEDIFGSYELKNSVEALKKKLTTKEWKILMVLYNNNNSLTEASKVLNVSRQAVEQVRNSIRYKLVTICDLAI